MHTCMYVRSLMEQQSARFASQAKRSALYVIRNTCIDLDGFAATDDAVVISRLVGHEQLRDAVLAAYHVHIRVPRSRTTFV